MSITSLSDVIEVNRNFKSSVNLYLHLNKEEKIKSYIPTKSSIAIMEKFLLAVEKNKSQATLLVGSYGKGKSHLLLVLLAVLSMKRSKKNNEIVTELISKIKLVDSKVAILVEQIWNKQERFLPVLIMNDGDDLRQSFMVALNNALKREKLTNIMPASYYSAAIETIERWKNEYKKTYENYIELIEDRGQSEKEMMSGLKNCSAKSLEIFREIHPELTSGSKFNPLASGDVVSMYKSVAETLREEHGFSGLYIVFDEFSKYIEAQDKHAPGAQMKLLQDICELANESNETQIFITMIAHKSMKEYGSYLSQATINAFTGIEGRIEETLFTTSPKNNYELVKNSIMKKVDVANVSPCKNYVSEKRINEYYTLPIFKSTFEIEDFREIVVKGCYPLSPVAAYALINVSEKVAQNERTLFTFISKDEPHSMANYIGKHMNDNQYKEWVITPYLIYDYFSNQFKKEVSNELIHTEWLNAEYALGETNVQAEKQMLKTLAIIGIIHKFTELAPVAENLILASGLADGRDVLESLVDKNIIYKKSINNQYAFKTRAGSALKTEIRKRRVAKENVRIPEVLSQISNCPFVLPKQYNSKYAMTRYFRMEYMDVEDFMMLEDLSVLLNDELYEDGKILTLYQTKSENYEQEILAKLEKNSVKNLVVIYSSQMFRKQRLVQDFEIVSELQKDIKFIEQNAVLAKELFIMCEEIQEELALYLDETFGERSERKVYYFDGKWNCIETPNVSRVLDRVCEVCFSRTLVINNEMINKKYITTSPIKKARKVIVESILNKQDDELFFNGTSAEATIYRAVIVNSGIKENLDCTSEIMGMFDSYFEQCINQKVELSKLIDQFCGAPFGMRKGVFSIIFAYKLSEKHEDVVVYYKNKEVEVSADTIISMSDFPDEYSLFISKDDAEKQKYLDELSEMFDVESANDLRGTRLANIVVCMQRWYRALPQNAKNIKTTSEYLNDENIVLVLPKLKKIMQQAEVNSYEILFDKLLHICSNSKSYANTILNLKKIKNFLDGYMRWILDEAIDVTIRTFDPKAKENLTHTLQNWYENQSELARNGLNGQAETGLMNMISELATFDDYAIVQKVVKVVTETYIDSWDDSSLSVYEQKLKETKEAIEAITEDKIDGKLELTFYDMNGEKQHKYYEPVDEGTGSILRNILDDTMEDFSDLSVNDKVAILIEQIEKVLRRGE